jgi:hypothetical protein
MTLGIIFEISTKNYINDLLVIKKSLSHMETLVGGYNGYTLSEPSTKCGWTFFNLSCKSKLKQGIEESFADMISKYRV